MYKHHLLPTILALTATVVLPAAAQKDHTAYCDLSKKAPNKDGCIDIKDNGVSAETSYGRDEWWSGNCRVKLNNGITNSDAVSGQDLKDAIQNILDRCDVGFEYVGNVRIDVDVCTVGQGGIVTECNSPLQHVQNSGVIGRSVEDPSAPRRRHLTDVAAVKRSPNPSYVFSRADVEPFPGIICGGGPGSAQIADCKALADEILAEHSEQSAVVTLPFKKSNQGCMLHVWPLSRDKKDAPASHVAAVVKEDSDICADATKTIIGFISNYVGSAGEGSYHMFFGQFCGRLGEGSTGACFPGGR